MKSEYWKDADEILEMAGNCATEEEWLVALKRNHQLQDMAEREDAKRDAEWVARNAVRTAQEMK